MLTGSSGQVTDTYDYTAFGTLLAHSGTTNNTFQYVGESFDPNCGFYYNRARWYDPANGRFVSMDPAWGRGQKPLRNHRYVFSALNPINAIDPSGRSYIEMMTIIATVTSLATAQVSTTATPFQPSAGIRAILRNALYTGIQMIKNANNTIQNRVWGLDLYKIWYDQNYSSGNVEAEARYIYTKQEWNGLYAYVQNFNEANVKFDCSLSGSDRDDKTRGAGIGKGGPPFTIYIFENFFTVPSYDMAEKSQASVLAHELAHAYGIPGDYYYGTGDCLNAASKHPELTIFNADSYMYFSIRAMSGLFDE
jgi:RHS repeat-associated protein